MALLINTQGHQFFIEVKEPIEEADSVTLTINELNTARNAPDRYRLALVSMSGDAASPPLYVIGIDLELPLLGDTQITKNLQQFPASGRAPH
ncbi:MAG: Uncharacterised protein [Prochlorococcus marinus str. MIT 9215]|nr:MAG: Uncharacterised protein [Prochlorococcus marinus str. MIT 9215]